MLVFDRWELRPMSMDIRHLAETWHRLQAYPTLFSDATKGDIQNWISLLQAQNFVWYEAFEGETNVGLIYVQMDSDDADLHIVFYDRKPAEKRELVRFFCRFLFDSLPGLARISCVVPAIYHGTCRLASAIGRWEGTKRQAVSIGGKRVDVHLYGLLREESYGIPDGKGKADQLNTQRYPATEARNRESVSTGVVG